MDKAYRANTVSKSPGYQGVIKAPSMEEVDPEFAARFGASHIDKMREAGFFTAVDYAESWGISRRTTKDRLDKLAAEGKMECANSNSKFHAVRMYRPVKRKK